MFGETIVPFYFLLLFHHMFYDAQVLPVCKERIMCPVLIDCQLLMTTMLEFFSMLLFVNGRNC